MSIVQFGYLLKWQPFSKLLGSYVWLSQMYISHRQICHYLFNEIPLAKKSEVMGHVRFVTENSVNTRAN